jgi:2-haloacid dehalogenase
VAVREGRRPWCTLDVLHRENLDDLLAQPGAPAADEAERTALVGAWHALDAWPEVPAALAALRTHYLLAPLSNAHVALAVALSRRNGFVWDAVLGAEFAQDYKPSPAVYDRAVEAFGLDPKSVLMVAAHSADLAAAAARGLRTAHVARPDENGPAGGETAPSVPVDYAAADLAHLAALLGEERGDG